MKAASQTLMAAGCALILSAAFVPVDVATNVVWTGLAVAVVGVILAVIASAEDW